MPDNKQLDQINSKPRVLAIGNFDGVHRGHQNLLGQARMVADQENLPLSVLTFDPHPRVFFKPQDPFFFLQAGDQKYKTLRDYGVDEIIALPFDGDMANRTADSFVHDILINQIQAKHIFIGDDFHFGHGRQGNVAFLIDHAANQYQVHAVSLLEDQTHQTISSTRIRQALEKGEPDLAANLLGRSFQIEGMVQRGDQRGRELGYPTANIDINGYCRPQFGIYAVRVHYNNTVYNGVANLGIRPMFETKRPLLEAHLFNFDGDLYDQTLQVDLIAFLRPEEKFDSLDALIAQMDQDSAQAKEILK